VCVCVNGRAAAWSDYDGERQAGGRHHQRRVTGEGRTDRARVARSRSTQEDVHVDLGQRPRPPSSALSGRHLPQRRHPRHRVTQHGRQPRQQQQSMTTTTC